MIKNLAIRCLFGAFLLTAIGLILARAQAFAIPTQPVMKPPNLEVCSRLLGGSLKSFPPSSWIEYLESRAKRLDALPTLRSEIPSAIVSPPHEDARLFQFHRYSSNILPSRFEDDINAELELPGSNFRYVNTVRAGDFSVRADKGLKVIRPLSGGPEFSIPDLPRRSQFKDDNEFVSRLNQYLGHIEQIVSSDKRDHALDYYFSTAEQLAKHGDSFGPSGSVDRLGKYDRQSSISFLQNDRVVQEFPVEVFTIKKKFTTDIAMRIVRKITYRRGNLLVSTLDTHIEYKGINYPGQPQRDWENLPTEAELIKSRKEHIGWINELMAVLYPDYVSRRKWPQSFIDSDYEKVLATANHTRYVSVREMSENGQAGSYLSIIGLNRANYGSITSFDQTTGIWKQQIGPFGDGYWSNHADMSLKQGPGGSPILTDSMVPQLKMEAYLGVHLNRPSVITEVIWPTVESSTFVNPTPIYLGEGVIYEPVKFYLAKKTALKGVALTELVAALTDSIFSSFRGTRFDLDAQYLYTFNPLREGQLLYSCRGYRTIAECLSVMKDGVEWHIFGQSSADFAKMFHSLSEEDSQSEAGQFIMRVRDSVEASELQR